MPSHVSSPHSPGHRTSVRKHYYANSLIHTSPHGQTHGPVRTGSHTQIHHVTALGAPELLGGKARRCQIHFLNTVPGGRPHNLVHITPQAIHNPSLCMPLPQLWIHNHNTGQSPDFPNSGLPLQISPSRGCPHADNLHSEACTVWLPSPKQCQGHTRACAHTPQRHLLGQTHTAATRPQLRGVLRERKACLSTRICRNSRH